MIPEGWKLVPIEPTDAMVDACYCNPEKVHPLAKKMMRDVLRDAIASVKQSTTDYQSRGTVFEISRGRVFTVRKPGALAELRALIGGNITIDGRVYELLDVNPGPHWIGNIPQDFALVVKHDH